MSMCLAVLNLTSFRRFMERCFCSQFSPNVSGSEVTPIHPTIAAKFRISFNTYHMGGVNLTGIEFRGLSTPNSRDPATMFWQC